MTGPVRLVIFEGWCVGTPPQDEAALAAPMNALEREEDPEGRWRRAANVALAGPYAGLFARLDALVLLRVPDFEAVLQWRRQQERELRARTSGGMDDAALVRFVAHYERLTRHALAVLPARADVDVALDADHRVAAIRAPR